jgi:hypothetical protein
MTGNGGETAVTTPPERPEISGSGPALEPPGEPRFNVEERAGAFGRRAEALGQDAEAAALRWSANPAVKETAAAAGRAWSLILLAIGIWFFADITLRLRMPSIAWRDLWPLVLIVFGGYIVLKGMTRRP